ncbi:unnamed protein product [Closterium sp. Yama58-4]|nr:unnamed protein product [Closterium sp. Yama58-4]
MRSIPISPFPTTFVGEFDPVYIVRLKDPPVTAYSGGIGGYPATAPAATAANALGRLAKSAKNAAKQLLKRTKLNARAPNVKAFVKFLKNQQLKVAKDVGVARNKLIHSYTHVENGFAAVLSPKQVRSLQSHPDVAAVTESVRLSPSTTHSPQFLRLPQSLWATAGGETSAGEDVVVGVIDSGIWPEHASFVNTDVNPYGDPPATFKGECQTTADFPACNGKVVGARYFNGAFSTQVKGKIDFSTDFNSPRDTDGHGTWCASAAAGNNGVPVGDLTASGMAPRARLAVYKIFWTHAGSMWANSADVNAAVNAAVADGVDVLSLSFGGVDPRATYFDDLPFLNAHASEGPVTISSKELKGLTFLESPDDPDEAPLLAPFSSTGPLAAPAAIPAPGRPTNDILKPDIIAPGVQLWGAAPSPSLTDYDNYFKRLSGTSMATPHVAGIVALIIQQKPTWTPAQIMSAIMTTASVTNNRDALIRTMSRAHQSPPIGDRVATPWEIGAGHVNPTNVLDPGLTYDSNETEYRNFLAGLNMNQAKKEFRSMTVKAIRACNLNRASISVSKLQRTLTVTRRVTNVASETSTRSAHQVSSRDREATRIRPALRPPSRSAPRYSPLRTRYSAPTLRTLRAKLPRAPRGAMAPSVRLLPNVVEIQETVHALLYRSYGLRLEHFIVEDGHTRMACWVPASHGKPAYDDGDGDSVASPATASERRSTSRKPPLLLIHGFGASSLNHWIKQIPVLSRHFELYIPSLVFFFSSTSASSKRRGEFFQAEAMLGLMDALGIERCQVVGLSYGGIVAYRPPPFKVIPPAPLKAPPAIRCPTLPVALPPDSPPVFLSPRLSRSPRLRPAPLPRCSMATLSPSRVARLAVAGSGVMMNRAEYDALIARWGVDSTVPLFLPRTPAELLRLIGMAHRETPYLPEWILQDAVDVIFFLMPLCSLSCSRVPLLRCRFAALLSRCKLRCDLTGSLHVIWARFVHVWGAWYMVQRFFENREEKAQLLEDLREQRARGNAHYPETLIVWGEDDAVFPISIGYRMHKHFGSCSRLEVFEKGSHALQADDTARFNHTILTFLLHGNSSTHTRSSSPPSAAAVNAAPAAFPPGLFSAGVVAVAAGAAALAAGAVAAISAATVVQ